jgi:hypothetical protein
VLQTIARQLGLRSDGVTGKPPTATKPLVSVRTALYKPWTANIDEGWTRWLLEQHEFPFKSITNADVRAGQLKARFDAIILPSELAERLIGGQSDDALPAEYAGGLGEAGIAALKTFVESGGTLIAMDQAAGFAISVFNLPVRDVTRQASTDAFLIPGSIVRVDLDPSQPLAYGMNPHTAGFFNMSAAYEILGANQVATAAKYATTDLLVSGWLEGENVIAGRPAVVQVSVPFNIAGNRSPPSVCSSTPSSRHADCLGADWRRSIRTRTQAFDPEVADSARRAANRRCKFLNPTSSPFAARSGESRTSIPSRCADSSRCSVSNQQTPASSAGCFRPSTSCAASSDAPDRSSSPLASGAAHAGR